MMTRRKVSGAIGGWFGFGVCAASVAVHGRDMDWPTVLPAVIDKLWHERVGECRLRGLKFHQKRVWSGLASPVGDWTVTAAITSLRSSAEENDVGRMSLVRVCPVSWSNRPTVCQSCLLPQDALVLPPAARCLPSIFVGVTYLLLMAG